MADAKMIPLAAKPDDDAPYFAVVLVPGWEANGAAMSGAHRRRRLGTGRSALSDAGSRRAALDGRRGALRLWALSRPRAGARRPEPPPVRQSRRRRARRRGAPSRRPGRQCRGRLRRRSGRLRHGGGGLRADRVRPGSLARARRRFVPGITAMLAVAARIGAPLGHDFCALSLSDNLKPWELVERRLDAAAGAGFVIALYNPISRARPWQFGKRHRTAAPASARRRRRWCSAAPSAGPDEQRDRHDARRRPMPRQPTWRRW